MQRPSAFPRQRPSAPTTGDQQADANWQAIGIENATPRVCQEEDAAARMARLAEKMRYMESRRAAMAAGNQQVGPGLSSSLGNAGQGVSRKRPADIDSDSLAGDKLICTGLERSGTSTGNAGQGNGGPSGAPSAGSTGDDGWLPPPIDDDIDMGDFGNGLFVSPDKSGERASPVGDDHGQSGSTNEPGTGKEAPPPTDDVPPPGQAGEGKGKGDGKGKGKGDGSGTGKDHVLMWDADSQSFIPTPDEALHKKRLQEAMNSKVELSIRRVRIEDRVKTGDRFAPPLLELIDHFISKDLERDAVIHDANLSDPLSLTLGIEGHHGMSLKEWLSIEPRSDDESLEAWYTENVLTNMIMLDAPPQGIPSSAYVADPAALYIWLSATFDPKTQVQRIKGAVDRLQAGSQLPMIDGFTHDFPAANMPTDAKCMVFAYNTDGHWVTIKLEPDFVSRQGKIILYDSLGGKNVKKRVELVMPWFARLVNHRSDLTWNQISWTVEHGQSTIQRNGSDCGPITASNCIALLNDRVPEVHVGRAQTLAFGQQLRYEFMCKLFQRFMSKPVPGVVDDQGDGSDGGPSAGTDGGRSAGNGKGGKSDGKGESGNDSKSEDGKSGDQQITNWNKATSEFQQLLSTKTRIEYPDYRMHLCDALVKYGALVLDELVTAVSFEVDDDAQIEGEETLTALLQALLEETDFMFERQDDDTWEILEGVGRSVDSATRARLLGWQPSAGIDDDDTGDGEVSWDLAIAIVRSSEGVRNIDSTHARMERCQKLMEAYWNTFHDGDVPGELQQNAGGDWVLEKSSSADWASYYRENQSSTIGVFSGAAPADAKIRSLLSTANAQGAAEERVLNVRLIANGHDGATTNNDSWASLRVNWPWLSFDLSIALSEVVTPSGMFEDGSGAGVKWGHYSVDGLLTLLEGGADAIKPPSPRASDIDVDPTLRGDSGPSQQDLRTHHEQFLFVCQTINCLKLDFSLEKRRADLPVRGKFRNGLAHVLTCGVKRNRFPLDDMAADHSKDEVKPHKCPECTYATKCASHLKRHVATVHRESGVKPHKCPECMFATEYAGNLQRHVAEIHPESEVKLHKCPACTYTAKRGSDLKTHMATVHRESGVKPHKCPACIYATKRASDLKRHMAMVHRESEEKLHKCPKCPHVTNHPSALKRHMAEIHRESEVKLHKCPACTYTAKRAGNLKAHIAMVHRESEEKLHKCPKCPHTTNYPSALKRHMAEIHRETA